MAYQIKFDQKADEDFSRLDNSVKKQIKKYISKIAAREDPRTLGEPLTSSLAGLWRYRVGDYRLIADIQDDVLVVLMISVMHRREVYKIANKNFK